MATDVVTGTGQGCVYWQGNRDRARVRLWMW